MKKQVGLLVVLLTLVFSTFGLSGRTFVLPAKATYVEGPITQDTLWTLVDSPFVVSKDIVVYPNATLTVESGVEVQFGGNFSITIQGRLTAAGTQDKRIEFTSNKYEPQSGDWKTIDFVGPQPSSMAYCIVEYATNGISVIGGNVAIENCIVGHCQENGIAATGGDSIILNCNISLCFESGINATSSDLTAQGNVIMQNNASGLLVSGDGNVVIQRNRIIGNTEGIVLTGNYTAGVTIGQNIIAGNGEDGVLVDADAHSGVIITNNTVSSNKNGFCISTPASTYLSDNSVSYNENGFVYSEGTHTAYRNDIYGNSVGMEAADNATVAAESNYWGDSSGPYHPSLNPYGRGNAVEGSSTSVDFIFFLTEPIGYINTRPTARLLTDRILVRPNDAVMFFATNSSDEGHIDRFLFDFDDGGSTSWTTLSVFTHEYSTPGAYHANLTVMDDFGATSLKVTTTVSVQNLPSLYVTIDVGKPTVNETAQVPVTVHVTDGSSSIENAGVTVFSVKGGSFAPSSGLTNTTGHFVSIFTTPDIGDITNVRIVARASLSGHVEGSGYEYLEVLPFLAVQVNPSSSTVKSEGSTPITINVRSNDQPVANAYVAVSSDNGNLSSTTGMTDSNGAFLLVFTAPMTTQSLTATVMASARKEGYVDGTGNALIAIGPKVLDIHVSADPAVTLSEARLNVTVHVEYEMTPIEGASISIDAENGTLSLTSGLTDINGSLMLGFTVPAVKTPTQIGIVANASMLGYAGNQGQTAVIVNPKTLKVMIGLSSNAIQAEEAANVTVSVTCNEDGKPVAGALVTRSSSDGNFSGLNGVTDSYGRCMFVFNSPQTTDQVPVVIAANVTANGYVNGGNQTTITVTPRAIVEAVGGFPMWTLLLIIIPVVIVVVVVVLVKLKIITVSSNEEE
jgi:hypothetical protein